MGGRCSKAPVDFDAADRWMMRAGEAATRSGNPQEIAWITQIRETRRARSAGLRSRAVVPWNPGRVRRPRRPAIRALRPERARRHVLRRSGRIDEGRGGATARRSRGWQRSGNAARRRTSSNPSRTWRCRGATAFGERGCSGRRSPAGGRRCVDVRLRTRGVRLAGGRLRGRSSTGILGSAWAEGGKNDRGCGCGVFASSP